MADKQYIKKMKMPIGGETKELHIKDAEAIDTINGYTKEEILTEQITFANEPISNAKINEIFGVTEGN